MEAKTIYGIGVYDPKVPHTYQPSNLSKVKKIAERVLLIESPKAICERLISADEQQNHGLLRKRLIASFVVRLGRFTNRRLSCIPGNVKLWESPAELGVYP